MFKNSFKNEFNKKNFNSFVVQEKKMSAFIKTRNPINLII